MYRHSAVKSNDFELEGPFKNLNRGGNFKLPWPKRSWEWQFKDGDMIGGFEIRATRGDVIST